MNGAYLFWGVREDPEEALTAASITFIRRCDPRLLERLGVRKEVCEAARQTINEQGTGE